MGLAGDLSNYNNRIGTADLTQIQAWNWVAAIVRVGLENANNRALTVYQLQALYQAVSYLFGYIWAYPNLDEPEQVIIDSVALAQSSGVPVLAYFMDVEDPKNIVAPGQYASWLARAFAQADAMGIVLGIYTGSWFWVPNLANSTEFANRPLWNANPNGNPALQNFGPYGGWEREVVKQYQFNQALPNGTLMDLDSIDDTWLQSLLPTQQPINDPIQIANAIKRLKDAMTGIDNMAPALSTLSTIAGNLPTLIASVRDNVDNGMQDISGDEPVLPSEPTPPIPV